jgi:hypothetical protein
MTTKVTITGNITPAVTLTTEGHAVTLGGITLVLDAVQFADLLDTLNAYTSNTRQRTWQMV